MKTLKSLSHVASIALFSSALIAQNSALAYEKAQQAQQAQEPQKTTASTTAAVTLSTQEQQIREIEWNLKHSSIATAIDKSIQNKSLIFLNNARHELSLGNTRTAEGLISRAARPLHDMSPAAMAGKHPDTRLWLNERRETLASITRGSEKIALEKGASTEFAKAANAALTLSQKLEQQGKPEKALEVIELAYAAVQTQVAYQRNGQTFYIAIAEAPADRQWSDGLRRFDERKQLTEYLILEANADGIDAGPLYSGMQAAESSRQLATEMAAAKRWDLALHSLDIAYVKFEDAWKEVGLEW